MVPYERRRPRAGSHEADRRPGRHAQYCAGQICVQHEHDGHHFPQIAELIAPQGRFGLIDDPEPFDLRLIKVKSISTHWENMFTRSIFQTEDMDAQHDLLSRLSKMIDDGQIRTTLAEVLGPINAANLGGAHNRIWERRAPGKMVMVGF